MTFISIQNAFNQLFSSGSNDDDLVNFLDDDESIADLVSIKPWKILVTDDDQTVHDSTVLALNGVKIHGRPIQFLHAFSASEGREMLVENPEIALILLDVVMETVDAGFRLVDVIREELKLKDLRIVIRTGQPGGVHTAHEAYRASVDAFTIKSKITRSALIEVLEEMLKPPATLQ
ncbi:response regulator [Sapientia aquatica]|uniref:Response regulator n=1 Tax=Sapientia aquatica TaxID=1549640 RepID=A0A4R5VYF4_9BURK|nr:response regulator [Sapientia aquatica]TDK63481.1 response regulator [Sapientia aquatica]